MKIYSTFVILIMSIFCFGQKDRNLVEKKIDKKWGYKYSLSEKLDANKIYRFEFTFKSSWLNKDEELFLYSIIHDEKTVNFRRNRLRNAYGRNFCKTRNLLNDDSNNRYSLEYYHASNGKEKQILFWIGSGQHLDLVKKGGAKYFVIENIILEDVTDSYDSYNIIPNGGFEIYHLAPVDNAGNGCLQQGDWQKLDEDVDIDTIIYGSCIPTPVLFNKKINLTNEELSYTNKKRISDSLSDFPEQCSLDSELGYLPPYCERNYVSIAGVHKTMYTSELLRVKLKYPLIKDTSYIFSLAYYVYGSYEYFVTNEIGVTFSTNPIVYPKHFNDDTCYFEETLPLSSNVLKDTTWTIIQIEFVAKGGEKYLTLGKTPIKNHIIKNETLKGLRRKKSTIGLYYFDDIRLIPKYSPLSNSSEK